MTTAQPDASSPRKPLRLWPGVLLGALQGLTGFVLPAILPDQGMYWFLGTFLAGLAIVVWWAFFSRAPRAERFGVVLWMIVALFATSRILHPSVAQAGMGMLFVFYAVPLVGFAFVVAVVASVRLADRPRRAVLGAVILLASGGWALVRSGGISAAGGPDFKWRWSPTPEERLLARSADEPQPSGADTAAPAATVSAADWPGFRGPQRDGVVPGVRIATDWSKSPPIELWRRPVGPAWSSCAVRGDLVYTQEQRGDDELVTCYRLTTGEPVWKHRDATRFWEANAGPGPRGTPAVSDGRVYTFGATGLVNALDAATGAVVWSRNVAAEAAVAVPYWGFASSPLVAGDEVIVAAAGRLVALDRATGEPRWLGPAHGGSYASPHLVTLDGVAQVLLLDGDGATSLAPADGTVLWQHAWPGTGMLQPALTADGDVLITTADMSGGAGTRRLALTHSGNAWTVQERWVSRGLKPYFNDFVVHAGHAYGFDGSMLACMNLADGARTWKGGRYGSGQLVLLSDQNLLLVLSEEGELALVAALPGEFAELARHAALAGKTWNHPVLAGDVLLVRNDQEMAAFRLTLE